MDRRVNPENFGSLNGQFMSDLTHNIGSVLSFIMPILLFFIAIAFARKFISIAKVVFSNLFSNTPKERRLRGDEWGEKEERLYNKKLKRQGGKW